MKDLFPRPPETPNWSFFPDRDTAENYSKAFIVWQQAYMKRYALFFGIGFLFGALTAAFYTTPFILWSLLS